MPGNIGVGKPYDPDERRQHYLLAYCHQMQNNESEARAYFDNVSTFTQTTMQRSSPNHILGLKAMKKLGQTDEGNNLLQSVLENVGSDTAIGAWLQVVEKNDTNRLYELFDLYAVDPQYSIISRIVKVTD